MGPVDLAVGDLFARQAAVEVRDDRARFIVRPRTVGTSGIERPDQWGGTERSKAGLSEDPSRFAGVRPYAPATPSAGSTTVRRPASGHRSRSGSSRRATGRC